MTTKDNAQSGYASRLTAGTDLVQQTLAKPCGARFYRCALQVNPFEYVGRHQKATAFADEAGYNQAIVQACIDAGIEAIAVTDHYRVRTAESLWTCARVAGIRVFPGFEAVTKDGVHLLCLFDPSKDMGGLDRVLGDCGIHEDRAESPTGKYDTQEFLLEASKWGAVCIAAHVAAQGGLLTTLSGQPAINAWRSPHLLACSLPGPADGAPDNLRPILKNRNPEYQRPRPLAIINAQDVNSPDDLARPGTSCWIKMSEVSIDGLRQAFLDPASRIRLNSDPPPEDHAELVALAWQGGFLDGASVHFNGNLNVLIGGRGAGKSTMIESIRYVLGLEPLGEEARRAHEGIILQVLKSGTKISLLVRSHRPAEREYLIERTVPNPPVVRDENGKVLPLLPGNVIEQVEVYGQHEISEITRSREKLTRLIERFAEHDPNLGERKNELKRELERSRARILDTRKELRQVEERLASLPALQETLKTYQNAGLEERLKEKSLLVREEQILNTTPERIAVFRDLAEQLGRELPIDLAFVSSKALEELPGKEILAEIAKVFERLNQELRQVASQLEQSLQKANQEIGEIRGRWEDRKRAVQDAYEKILRELQKAKVDGAEFIRLRRQIEELRPLKERQAALKRNLKEHEEQRGRVIIEWEDVKAEEFRELQRAEKKVNRELVDRVRVTVTCAGNRQPLIQHLQDEVGGRLRETIDKLSELEAFSLKELADTCRSGRDALAQRYGIPPFQADRIAQAPADVILQLEELDLPATTRIDLNVAAEKQAPIWQALEDLSTGQKATAVLLLLLLESVAPLVVDQPEDDLDNRFITDGIVPKMREEKRRRQFVFATHNANIPVLGDAELIVGLSAAGEAGQGKAQMPLEHMGSIDARSVRELVEEVLEGGKEAFEMRRLKYGF